jgi:RNA polymerase sigma-54 factor
MTLVPRLDLRQSQTLVMTPQLRQALRMLQSSNLDVAAFVEEELERNPLLERAEGSVAAAAEAPAAVADGLAEPPAPPDSAEIAASDRLAEAPLDADWSNVVDEGEAYAPRIGVAGPGGEDAATVDDLGAPGPSLRESLAQQIRLTFATPQEQLIAGAMLGMLEPSGRLTVDVVAMAARLGCEPAVVEAVRLRLQRLEPAGMFAANLAECLAAQLAERNRLDPAMQTLLANLDLLARREMGRLMQRCGVDAEDLAEMIAELKRLDPKPGAGLDETPAQLVQPDVLMRPAQGGGWVLEMNPETLPRVLVRHGFAARALVSVRDREGRAFITEQLQSANWLARSLEQRANTILKVAGAIVARQEGFFRHGVGFLRPLMLRDISAELEMHESTVSRVTSSKYIATPRGTLELKYFFTTAIQGADGNEAVSALAVRHRIKSLIDGETPTSVLSDDQIVTILRQEGVDIARRTVAKYRDAMRIPSSVQRRRDKEGKAVPA